MSDAPRAGEPDPAGPVPVVPDPVGAGSRDAPLVPGERTLRLDLEFDGEAFAGWQRQGDRRTVQEEVERALERLLLVPTPVVGAGRTDAGVHARGMVASFRTASRMTAADLLRALDGLLPRDVGVLAVREAQDDFHARRDARWKWYRYTLLPSRRRRVHERRTSWRIPEPLDVPTLAAGLAPVAGRHDFARFEKRGSPRRTTVRTISGAVLSEERGLLHLDFVGNGFLYGMVRLLVGTIVDAGRRPDATPAAAAARMRALLSGDAGGARVGASAPAHGLSLMAVGFAGDEPPPFVGPSPPPDLESEAEFP